MNAGTLEVSSAALVADLGAPKNRRKEPAYLTNYTINVEPEESYRDLLTPETRARMEAYYLPPRGRKW